jgi:hypothetical protein
MTTEHTRGARGGDFALDGQSMLARGWTWTKELFTNKHRFGVLLIVIGGCLVIGWAIIAPTNWSNVLSSHSRLGYLVGDSFLVAPACAVAGYGFYKGYQWGAAAFLIVLGAVAFDLTHTFIYMAEIDVPSFGGSAPPLWAYAVVIVALWGLLTWWAWYVIRTEVAPDAGIRPWSWLIGFIPTAIIAIIVVALAYSLS